MLVRLGDLGHTSLGCQVSSVLLFEDKLFKYNILDMSV